MLLSRKLLYSGVTCIVLGVVVGSLLFPFLVSRKIKKQMRLEEGGEIFNKWVDVKLPILMKVYLFEIQNREEFRKGQKPVLLEHGPYVYQQRRQKVVEDIDTEADTILFRPKITYTFREDLSSGREDDVLHFINMPLVSVATKGAALSNLVRYLIKDMIKNNNETLFTERTVKEFLFDGYHEPMIEELSKLQGKQLMPDNRFGIYYKKNGTEQDLLKIYSGVLNNELFGKTISWEGKTSLDFWGTDACNMINGSDGSIFPPFVTRDRVLRAFSPDLCRSIYMTYEKDVEVQGIPGFKFTTPSSVLEDPRVNPENRCFCADPGENFEKCTKSGVFRLGPCREGAPVVASWPHFYDADKEYQEQSIGLNPSKEAHEAFLCIEPNTGALLEAAKRFQVNLELRPIKAFYEVKRVPKMILPVLWGEESVQLTEETAEMLKKKLFLPMKIVDIFSYLLMAVGAMVIVAGVVVMLLIEKKAT